jgi:hypothetical protein
MFLTGPGAGHGQKDWVFVCDNQEQFSAVASLSGRAEFTRVRPALLRDLEVLSRCLAAGWISGTFARRLFAHTPSVLVVIANCDDQHRWKQSALDRVPSGTESLLASFGRPRDSRECVPVVNPARNPPQESHHNASHPDHPEDELTPCAFLSLAGEPEVKVLAQNSRIIVEEAGQIGDRAVRSLRPYDRILLGRGTSRWSPAEEFTDAVVCSARESRPELADTAIEWRRALAKYRETNHASVSQLRLLLAAVGVSREEQTIDGWLDLERASPIAPRGLRTELTAFWPLIEAHALHSLSDVISACGRLRSLRTAAGGALLQVWRGEKTNLGVDEAWLAQLVAQLQQTVRAYEVMSVSFGTAPRAMVGWWIDPSLVVSFEASDSPGALEVESDEEEESV